MPRSRAWAPTSRWNCAPWSPTSPMSPSTSTRRPSRPPAHRSPRAPNPDWRCSCRRSVRRRWRCAAARRRPDRRAEQRQAAGDRVAARCRAPGAAAAASALCTLCAPAIDSAYLDAGCRASSRTKPSGARARRRAPDARRLAGVEAEVDAPALAGECAPDRRTADHRPERPRRRRRRAQRSTRRSRAPCPPRLPGTPGARAAHCSPAPRSGARGAPGRRSRPGGSCRVRHRRAVRASRSRSSVSGTPMSLLRLPRVARRAPRRSARAGCGEHLLDRGLAVAAGHRDQRQREAPRASRRPICPAHAGCRRRRPPAADRPAPALDQRRGGAALSAACTTKSWPSKRSPRRATNRSPGATLRVSVDTPLMRTAPSPYTVALGSASGELGAAQHATPGAPQHRPATATSENGRRTPAMSW